jgi:predicted nucleic acid-binding protein
MTLVDMNVLLDVLSNDPRWSEWSLRHLAGCGGMSPVIIDEIVYAEISGGRSSLAMCGDIGHISPMLR